MQIISSQSSKILGVCYRIQYVTVWLKRLELPTQCMFSVKMRFFWQGTSLYVLLWHHLLDTHSKRSCPNPPLPRITLNKVWMIFTQPSESECHKSHSGQSLKVSKQVTHLWSVAASDILFCACIQTNTNAQIFYIFSPLVVFLYSLIPLFVVVVIVLQAGCWQFCWWIAEELGFSGFFSCTLP